MSSLSSSKIVEENQRLLADYCQEGTDNGKRVTRFKYSNTASELSSLLLSQSSTSQKR